MGGMRGLPVVLLLFPFEFVGVLSVLFALAGIGVLAGTVPAFFAGTHFPFEMLFEGDGNGGKSVLFDEASSAHDSVCISSSSRTLNRFRVGNASSSEFDDSLEVVDLVFVQDLFLRAIFRRGDVDPVVLSPNRWGCIVLRDSRILMTFLSSDRYKRTVPN